MNRRAGILGLVLVLAIAPRAGAYDSQCFRPNGDACQSGPDAAQNRWLGPSDEHRLIWEHTRLLAGLPNAVSAPVSLEIFTGLGVVPTEAGLRPTLLPAPFAGATRVRQREFTIGELAQLPDFSYALWDWAQGNETCPLGDGIDAITCHDFRTHMGPVNSNHFLPQAGTFYAHYHALALGRAAACRDLADGVGTEAPRFRPVLEACEDEALVLEAVGHHYLQDAWSMGHMWERWGSPDPAAFPDPVAAIAVALASGLIHGARGVLQEYMSSPLSPYRDVPDALCAPSAGVLWRSPGMPEPALGLGDLYYPLLTDPSQPFGLQAERLFSCAAAGMREVYAAAGEQHGPLAPLDPALRPVDPLSDACFGQRATNVAMATAAALDLVKKDGTPDRIPLDGDLATALVIAGAEGGIPSETLQERYRLDMANALFRIRVASEVDPAGVEAASGTLPPLLGVLPNGAYVTSPPAPYTDPPLPWSRDDARSLVLARTFHRAHAGDWCAAMGHAEMLALPSLRARAQSDLPPDDRAAAIAVCAELAARHLRFGKDATAYDTAHEPLCAFVAGTTQYAYTGDADDVGPEDFAGTRAAAESWCVATTTTTTTSSTTTTTTLPLGGHVRVLWAQASATAGATAIVPEQPPVYHEEIRGSRTWPWAASASAASAASAAAPHEATATADGESSHASDVQLDAAGNLVRVSASGTARGSATFSNSRPHDQGEARVSALSQLIVRFQVIGDPVTCTVASTVYENEGPRGGASAVVAVSDLHQLPGWIIYEDGRHPGSYVDTAILPPGEYVLDAEVAAGAGADQDDPGTGAGDGGFEVTFTLAPAGEE